jgi:hypothetical protein
MHKFLLLTTTLLATAIAAPAMAFQGNYIGPGLTFGLGRNSDTTFGIESKFDVSDRLSLRPNVFFGNGGTQFGAALTYNLDIFNNSAFTPFLGAGVSFYNNNSGSSTTTPLIAIGMDYEFNPNWVLLTKVNVPLSNNLNSGFNISAGYRF